MLFIQRKIYFWRAKKIKRNNPKKIKSMKCKKLRFAFIVCLLFSIFPKIVSAAEGDVLWKTNFGGSRNDYLAAVTEVPNGVVAVGYSQFGSFGNGDWEDIIGKGDIDAIIIKFDNEGNVVWKKNFGGIGIDRFESVATLSDGIVAVGYSDFTSFENGDWFEFQRKGIQDATIVKFDNDGNVLWKNSFGGKNSGYSRYLSVTANFDEIVAVGYSDAFGANDLEDISGNGSEDAIVVKYDNAGNIVWKSHFGGKDIDRFFSVTLAADCIVAVGISYPESFENGDWEIVSCRGGKDAIMVKFDPNGNVVWKKNFGGSSDDYFYSVTTLSDGFVAGGLSFPNSFGNGDWEMDTCHGWEDAIIVKFDEEGNVNWKKSFGGAGWDCFYDVTTVPDGIIAVGGSDIFNSGDWKEITGKGSNDATIVKFDNAGNLLWKMNFGGKDVENYNSVTIVADGIIAVGYANFDSFDTGDWSTIKGNGWEDAIIVKYAANYAGIENYEQGQAKIKVFPNPTTGELTINNEQLTINSVEVFDIYGRKIYHLSNLKSQISNQIDISHLPTGIYFLKIDNQVIKTVKQ